MSASVGRLVVTEVSRVRYRFLTGVVGVSVAGVVIVAVSTFAYHTSHSFGPDDLRQAVAFFVAPLTVAALVIGASALGTDLSTRALTTLLLYEPRRRRVLAARAGVCAAAMAVLTTIVLAVLTLALVQSISTHRGEADASWWVAMATLVGRASVLTAAAAVVGVGLAVLTRGTLGAIAVSAGYAFLVEQPVAAFWPALSHWLPIGDAASWVTADGPHSALASGAVLAAFVLAIAAIADTAFRRQDIA
jgi:hypothetical protein